MEQSMTEQSTTKSYKGVVKWFNDAKGFGFIEHESGRDVFVHYSVIEQDGFKTLKDGEPVEYELREGDKGLNASRVTRVNAPEESAENSAEDLASSVEVESSKESSEEEISLTSSDTGSSDSTQAVGQSES